MMERLAYLFLFLIIQFSKAQNCNLTPDKVPDLSFPDNFTGSYLTMTYESVASTFLELIGTVKENPLELIESDLGDATTIFINESLSMFLVNEQPNHIGELNFNIRANCEDGGNIIYDYKFFIRDVNNKAPVFEPGKREFSYPFTWMTSIPLNFETEISAVDNDYWYEYGGVASFSLSDDEFFRIENTTEFDSSSYGPFKYSLKLFLRKSFIGHKTVTITSSDAGGSDSIDISVTLTGSSKPDFVDPDKADSDINIIEYEIKMEEIDDQVIKRVKATTDLDPDNYPITYKLVNIDNDTYNEHLIYDEETNELKFGNIDSEVTELKYDLLATTIGSRAIPIRIKIIESQSTTLPTDSTISTGEPSSTTEFSTSDFTDESTTTSVTEGTEATTTTNDSTDSTTDVLPTDSTTYRSTEDTTTTYDVTSTSTELTWPTETTCPICPTETTTEFTCLTQPTECPDCTTNSVTECPTTTVYSTTELSPSTCPVCECSTTTLVTDCPTATTGIECPICPSTETTQFPSIVTTELETECPVCSTSSTTEVVTECPTEPTSEMTCPTPTCPTTEPTSEMTCPTPTCPTTEPTTVDTFPTLSTCPMPTCPVPICPTTPSEEGTTDCPICPTQTPCPPPTCPPPPGCTDEPVEDDPEECSNGGLVAGIVVTSIIAVGAVGSSIYLWTLWRNLQPSKILSSFTIDQMNDKLPFAQSEYPTDTINSKHSHFNISMDADALESNLDQNNTEFREEPIPEPLPEPDPDYVKRVRIQEEAIVINDEEEIAQL